VPLPNSSCLMKTLATVTAKVAVPIAVLGADCGVPACAGDSATSSSLAMSTSLDRTKPPAERTVASRSHHAAGPDTEHIFGITMGSDIGSQGEFELELETFGGFGKRFGTYSTTATHAHFKYTLTDNFRIAPGFTVGTHDIRNVPDLHDFRAVGLHEASIEIRYKLLDRHVAPFGLTINIEPIASRIDDVSGQRLEGYGTVLSALMDKELIPDRLFAAFNLNYFGGASRTQGDILWSHDSALGLGAAMSTQVIPTVLVGIDARFLQAFEGMGFDRRKGQALFVGPTFSIAVTKDVGLSGTWSFQVAGKTSDDIQSLDLKNFERQQGLLRLTAHF
jgi:hypothetical protein